MAPETVAGLGRFMKGLAGRATRYRSRLDRRPGTLWESLQKSSVVEMDTYLLACTRYIELNPVRARMRARPEDYGWSSGRRHLGLELLAGLDPDPVYWGPASDAAGRCERYAASLAKSTPESELALIRAAVQRGQLTGSRRFVDEVGRIVGRRIEQRAQGRPPNAKTVWKGMEN